VLVQDVIRRSSSIFELRLERGNIDFTPGDCMSVYFGDNGSYREYSIASGVNDPYLGFIIRNMEHSQTTDYLRRLRTGDRLKVSQPYGWFRPGKRHGKNPFVFIATGTGIAPFLSYLRSDPQNPPVQFLYGVRRFEDAIGYDYFSKRCPTTLAVTGEIIGNTHHGRITDLLSQLPLTPKTHYYLCGLDVMIEDVSNWLDARGVEPTNIHREIFFYSKRVDKSQS
jgi:ferredoxin/flavodoxin---NADP+ reductase